MDTTQNTNPETDDTTVCCAGCGEEIRLADATMADGQPLCPGCGE